MGDIDRYDADLDRIVQESFRVEPPDVLYHYTTWAGAEGILSSRQFRFTAHDCTNDRAELISADHVVIEVANALRAKATGSKAKLLDLLLTDYSRAKTELGPAYLACFSQARNSDRQWEMYAEGGRGLCLGVRVLKHESMPQNQNVGISLLRVDYSEESWRERMMTGWGAVFEQLEAFQPNNDREFRRALELALNAMYRIGSFAEITAKKSQWSGEEEWRQVAFKRKGVVIQPAERQSTRGIVRYLQLSVRRDDKSLAVDEIIMGPKQDLDSAKSKLQRILTDVGYPEAGQEPPRITVAKAG